MNKPADTCICSFSYASFQTKTMANQNGKLWQCFAIPCDASNQYSSVLRRRHLNGGNRVQAGSRVAIASSLQPSLPLPAITCHTSPIDPIACLASHGTPHPALASHTVASAYLCIESGNLVWDMDDPCAVSSNSLSRSAMACTQTSKFRDSQPCRLRTRTRRNFVQSTVSGSWEIRTASDRWSPPACMLCLDLYDCRLCERTHCGQLTVECPKLSLASAGHTRSRSCSGPPRHLHLESQL